MREEIENSKTNIGDFNITLEIINPTTQELNQGLLHCRRILYQLSYEGSSIQKLIIFYQFLCQSNADKLGNKRFAQNYTNQGFPGGSEGMQKTWVQSQGWENPLEESMATHSSILAWRIPMDKGAWQATVHGVAKSQTQLSD